MILAGDIGGTNVRLCLYGSAAGDLRPIARRDYRTAAFGSATEVVEHFAKEHDLEVRAACLGVAGPVESGHTHLTNVDFDVDEASLREHLGIDAVRVINDLEATAHGILHLDPSSHRVLHPGRPPSTPSHMVVIAAGTGLGEAMIHYDREDDRWAPMATEGGHTEFGPRDAAQVRLLTRLWEMGKEHVSYEAVASASSIAMLYRFVCDERGEPPDAAVVESDDPNRSVTERALEGSCDRCAATLDLFASLLGAEAGNLALKGSARSGVYLAGGLAPRIASLLEKGPFLEAFVAKGRFRPFLEAIPVFIVNAPDAALEGAARHARSLLTPTAGRGETPY